MKNGTMARIGERVAAEMLVSSGYKIICRNWRCRVGEIDLIAREGEELVFVEIKARRAGIDDALTAVDRQKQRKLRQVARYYLASHNLTSTACRFDVVAVGKRGESYYCQLIRNAF